MTMETITSEWTFLDLNQGPTGYEPVALTYCAKCPNCQIAPPCLAQLNVRGYELPACVNPTCKVYARAHGEEWN